MRNYFLLIVVFLMFTSAVSAAEKYSVRGVYGWATSEDLGNVLFGKFSPDHKEYKVYSIDGGYLLWKNINEWPLDVYAKGGLSYYHEAQFDNAYGGDLYLKAFWNFDFYKNRVRFGFGEGISYTTKLLQIEKLDAIEKNSPTSKFLNYLDISLDFDIGRLFRTKALEDLYFGVLIKHRSGVFGLYNGVHGGSNYNSLYLEKNF